MNGAVLLGSVIYAIIGLVVFAVAYLIFGKIASKMEITKIIVEDNNTGLGIVIAGVFIGLAIIISAAIR